jgi:hypothetical protein
MVSLQNHALTLARPLYQLKKSTRRQSTGKSAMFKVETWQELERKRSRRHKNLPQQSCVKNRTSWLINKLTSQRLVTYRMLQKKQSILLTSKPT